MVLPGDDSLMRLRQWFDSLSPIGAINIRENSVNQLLSRQHRRAATMSFSSGWVLYTLQGSKFSRGNSKLTVAKRLRREEPGIFNRDQYRDK